MLSKIFVEINKLNFEVVTAQEGFYLKVQFRAPVKVWKVSESFKLFTGNTVKVCNVNENITNCNIHNKKKF